MNNVNGESIQSKYLLLRKIPMGCAKNINDFNTYKYTTHSYIHTQNKQQQTACVCVCVFLGKINMSHRKHSFNF